MTGALAKAVAIGGSAGAVQALLKILPALPSDYPHPVLIVVHVPPGPDNALVPLFQGRARMAVKEAEDKEPVVGGTVYFAPPDYHLLVEADHSLSLSSDEPVLFSRPSIDVLFESAADAYGAALVGIVLTGANSDGAKGLRAIVQCGGSALVQSPDSAFAATMPEAAIDTVPNALVMPLERIAACLQEIRV